MCGGLCAKREGKRIMRKIIALFLALALLLSAIPTLAEKRTAPEDKKVITTTDVVGAERPDQSQSCP